jgi:GT2 family glycosyltransferase
MKSTDLLCSIVVTHNAEEVILSCLESLEASSLPSTIMVIDNGSSDATVEMVTRRYPHIHVHAGENLGFAGGCNRGIQLAGADFNAYFFVNPDALVAPSCLGRLMSALEEDPTVAIVSPTILELETGSILYAGALLDFENLNFGVLTSSPAPGGSKTRETGRPSGAAMLVRRTSLDQVGPMDDSYFLYWEECEWAARLHSSHWKIGYVPDAEVFHSPSHSTGGTGSRVYEYYYTRNLLRLVSEVKKISRWECVVRVFPIIARRFPVLASYRQPKRLIEAARFDALGVFDFLRGKTGHRVDLPPVSIPNSQPK